MFSSSPASRWTLIAIAASRTCVPMSFSLIPAVFSASLRRKRHPRIELCIDYRIGVEFRRRRAPGEHIAGGMAGERRVVHSPKVARGEEDVVVKTVIAAVALCRRVHAGSLGAVRHLVR